MRLKQFIKANTGTFVLIILLFVMCAVTAFFKWQVALGELAVSAVITVFALLNTNNAFEKVKNTVVALNEDLSADEAGNLKNFPLPVLIFDSTDKILWYNILFRNYVMSGVGLQSDSVKTFTGGRGKAQIGSSPSFDAEINGKKYTVYFSHIDYKGEHAYALYYVDDTVLKDISRQYDLSKPVVSLVAVDSLDEIYRSYKESECAEIIANVERMIESWFASYSGIFRKLGNSRFIFIVPQSELEKMTANKFSILEQVRNYTYGGKSVGITLSVGTGRGNTLGDAESAARQALDMALGRGGDQLALKNPDESYRFFGGVSNGVEKRTKVRTRVVASAMAETIRNAENVLIMGHKFSDLDSLGAAVGILKTCQDLGTDARIVLSKKTSLAGPLVNMLKENNMDGFLSIPDYAEHMIGKKTLLIVVDTHRADFLESKAIYEKAPSVIVIDHHRKTVDHIDNAVIFYHEPHASSASEMVTELMEYINKVSITPLVANALLSGIMLDTKNFVLRTGTRTFEAAALLRSKGADTVTVKRFFNNSLENQKLRGQIVLSAYEYNNCAISVADISAKDIRLICAQAADELLTINDVKASFVLFETNDVVNISARSMGAVNVQLIMEEFGGGGHQTMAACQLDGADIEDVKLQLQEQIDKYFNNL